MRLTTSALSTAALLLIAAAPAHSADYAIDPGHTMVYFEVMHFGTSTNRGRFDKKEGKISYDAATKSGGAEITIDMSSINTGVAPFDTHLKSKDFFNVAEFPTARFSADKFNFDNNKLISINGFLTMLGKTEPVTLTANNFNCFEHPRLKREVCGGDFDTIIDRTQWGISFGAAVAPKEVRLLIQVEAVKQ